MEKKELIGKEQEEEIKAIIGKLANELHRIIGEAIDGFMIANKLSEDAITLNIVYNALSNNLQAIVINNHDIPEETVEAMIGMLSKRLRKAYQSRQNLLQL